MAKNLAAVRADLAKALRDPGHDHGSLAPLFIRFAWHCSGTYDAVSKTGGSNGATMRFPAEQADPENKGLAKAREVIAAVHRKHAATLSLADAHVLAGYVAFEATGGPVIPFATGRKDFTEHEAAAVFGPSMCPCGDGKLNPNGSRLPTADLGEATGCPMSAKASIREKPTIDHVRQTFQRMGLDDKETVVLIIMGHQYGSMHAHVSGFEHEWYPYDPIHWNVYGPGGLGYLTAYNMKARQGPSRERINAQNKRQFDMQLGGAVFAMMAADMALLWDDTYKQITLHYDQNRIAFHIDAANAWKKLTELGCDGLLSQETTPGHDKIRVQHIR